MDTDDTQIYRYEWRDIHNPHASPPPVMLRVAWNRETTDLATICFEMQAAVHAMTKTLQEETP